MDCSEKRGNRMPLAAERIDPPPLLGQTYVPVFACHTAIFSRHCPEYHPQQTICLYREVIPVAKTYFITLTGFKQYYDKKPFEPGQIVRLVKEPDNPYDAEAISVELPFIGRVAYVANSPNTVARGTSSAGRIYGTFRRETYAQVLFMTHASILCMLLPPERKKKPAPDPREDTVQAEPGRSVTEATEAPEKKPRRGAGKIRPGLIRQDSQGLFMEL